MNQKSTQTYWYWDNDADIALYARLLLSRGDTTRATTVLDGLLRRVNLGSYYVSTQTKIQTFMALIEHSSISKSTKDVAISLRSDGFIA